MRVGGHLSVLKPAAFEVLGLAVGAVGVDGAFGEVVGTAAAWCEKGRVSGRMGVGRGMRVGMEVGLWG